jgi:hypothetical protein
MVRPACTNGMEIRTARYSWLSTVSQVGYRCGIDSSYLPHILPVRIYYCSRAFTRDTRGLVIRWRLWIEEAYTAAFQEWNIQVQPGYYVYEDFSVPLCIIGTKDGEEHLFSFPLHYNAEWKAQGVDDAYLSLALLDPFVGEGNFLACLLLEILLRVGRRKFCCDNIRWRQGRSSAREILLRVGRQKFCWVSVVGVHRDKVSAVGVLSSAFVAVRTPTKKGRQKRHFVGVPTPMNADNEVSGGRSGGGRLWYGRFGGEAQDAGVLPVVGGFERGVPVAGGSEMGGSDGGWTQAPTAILQCR